MMTRWYGVIVIRLTVWETWDNLELVLIVLLYHMDLLSCHPRIGVLGFHHY